MIIIAAGARLRSPRGCWRPWPCRPRRRTRKARRHNNEHDNDDHDNDDNDNRCCVTSYYMICYDVILPLRVPGPAARWGGGRTHLYTGVIHYTAVVLTY